MNRTQDEGEFYGCDSDHRLAAEVNLAERLSIWPAKSPRPSGDWGRIRRINSQNITLIIIATLSASFAFAEDFKTVNGKEYKNATVTHVEADGIVVKTKSGISKVYFQELPMRGGIPERIDLCSLAELTLFGAQK